MRAPMLGQHSAEILTDYGFTSERITHLVDTQVIADRTAGNPQPLSEDIET